MPQRLWAAPVGASCDALPRLFTFMLGVRGWFSLNVGWGDAKAAQHLLPFSPCLCRGCSLGLQGGIYAGVVELKPLGKRMWRGSSIGPSTAQLSSKGFPTSQGRPSDSV